MATMITMDCINCGACEPECPNTAIYQGGVDWDMNGATSAAISNDIFYIVPQKCTFPQVSFNIRPNIFGNQ